MWSLVLMFYLYQNSNAGGLAATTIDNFSSKVVCEAAGQAFVNNTDVYQNNEVHTTGIFDRKQEVKTYRFYANVIAKSYQCVEVK